MNRLIDEKKIKQTDKFFDRIHDIQMEYLDYWKESTLWHWDFWLSLILVILPWVIWFIFRKRGSEGRLLLAGFVSLIIASWLDFIGVVFGLWHYSGKVVPTIPTFFPWDFSLIPVTMMLWLQFRPTANPLLKGMVYAAITSFIGEPLFEWIGLYTPERWSSFYSFPIYTFIYLIAYWFTRMKSFEKLC
ncbi:hypothetical protein GCM10008967_32660 [Bacillus carboniphilus]|uniref:Uncharacterized protein n=1 Tax=Bacillus carboniphilus TaxID=86663 RepID=A0ABP3G919_9BACI